jgi:hypothetical protein
LVVVLACEGDDVNGDTDLAGFEDVFGAVDGSEVKGDVTGEADEVAWLALAPRDGV